MEIRDKMDYANEKYIYILFCAIEIKIFRILSFKEFEEKEFVLNRQFIMFLNTEAGFTESK